MTYIGFTGARTGMTQPQKNTVARLLAELQPKQARHGDAVGSDADFHELARGTDARVIIHPPEDAKDRANCAGDKILPPKPYLDRNKDIVNACTVLIATPDSPQEKVRSGTWSTVRYGRKAGRRVIVVLPDGTI
jgi:hypothetical protein